MNAKKKAGLLFFIFFVAFCVLFFLGNDRTSTSNAVDDDPRAPRELETVESSKTELGKMEVVDVADVPLPSAWKEQATRAFSHAEMQVQEDESPLLPRLTSLEQKATLGDSQAAMQLHMDLFDCWEYLTAGAGQQTEEHGGPESIKCEGITLEVAERAFHWLEQAAINGDSSAAMLYAARGSAVVLSEGGMFKDPSAVQQFKQRAVGFVAQAAQRCNVEALGLLGFMYSEEAWGAPNQILAMAYSEVASRLSGTFSENEIRDPRSEVEVMAARIYKSYCL